MRNLKRALSLTLASVMLLGMMVVGSSAAGFPDVEDSHNVEAIEVLQAVDVMVGDDKGNFGPDQQVSRAQMAVVMAKLLNLDYNYYQGQNPFKDVPNWAAPYVAACYANGIVSGYNSETYGANDNVTAVQAASMMMRALGYFQYKEDYNGGFELATVKQASEIGMFSQVNADAKTPLTRNQVAQMALNALESEMVSFTGTPGTTYTASSGEQLSIGYVPKYEPRTSTELKYRAIEDRSSDVSGDSNHRGQYYIQLGEQLYDGKLTKKYARDDFERPSINWQYDGKEIGTYVDYELLVAGGTFTTGVKGSELYDLLTYSTIRDNDLLTYVDGVATNVKKEELVRSNKNNVNQSGTGVLTEVFLDESRDEIIITGINTYLAKANSDYNKTNESLSLKVYTGRGANGGTVVSTTKIVDSAVVAEAANVAKDDYKLIYMSGKENATSLTDYTRFEVVRMFDTNIVAEASITKWEQKDNIVVGNFTANGNEYKTNVKGFYDGGNVLTDYNENLLTDMSYNIYEDRYGNAIGVDLAEGTKNYVFITGYDRLGSNISVRTADAAAIFMDGTMDVITVNVTDTNKYIEKSKNGQFEKWQNWNQDAYGQNGRRSENRWYTYTVNSNNVYTLKPVERFFWTNYADLDAGTVTEKVLNTANLFVDDSKTTPATYVKQGRAYGNDNSVYITVDVDEVDTSVGKLNAITEVDGVYTGAQNVKLELNRTDKQALGQLGENNAAYVYSIYDSNYYLIASVVLGEAQGATANYAYILGGAKNERIEYETASARANGDETYYWEFDAVVNGEETTLTAKTKYASVFSGLEKFHVQELRFDGDYVVKITDVKPEKVMLENNVAITDKMDVYDVGHVQSVNASGMRTDTGNEPNGNHANTQYQYSSHRLDGTIELVGRTLYVERGTGRDVGLALTSDAKAVLVQYENGEREVTSCGSVSEAVGRLADADTNVTGTQFRGRIAAALESNGAARWVVIISDTPLNTTDKNYNYNYSTTINNVEVRLVNSSTSSVQNRNITATLDRNGELTIGIPVANNVIGASASRVTATVDGVYRADTNVPSFAIRGSQAQWTLSGQNLTENNRIVVTIYDFTATTGAQAATITKNDPDNAATVSPSTGLYVGDTFTLTVKSGYKATVTGATKNADGTYTITSANVVVNVTKNQVPAGEVAIVDKTPNGGAYAIKADDATAKITSAKAGDKIRAVPSRAVEFTGAGVTANADGSYTVTGTADVEMTAKTGWVFSPLQGFWSGTDADGNMVFVPTGPLYGSLASFALAREVVDPTTQWLKEAINDTKNTYTVTVGTYTWVSQREVDSTDPADTGVFMLVPDAATKAAGAAATKALQDAMVDGKGMTVDKEENTTPTEDEKCYATAAGGAITMHKYGKAAPTKDEIVNAVLAAFPNDGLTADDIEVTSTQVKIKNQTFTLGATEKLYKVTLPGNVVKYVADDGEVTGVTGSKYLIFSNVVAENVDGTKHVMVDGEGKFTFAKDDTITDDTKAEYWDYTLVKALKLVSSTATTESVSVENSDRTTYPTGWMPLATLRAGSGNKDWFIQDGKALMITTSAGTAGQTATYTINAKQYVTGTRDTNGIANIRVDSITAWDNANPDQVIIAAAAAGKIVVWDGKTIVNPATPDGSWPGDAIVDLGSDAEDGFWIAGNVADAGVSQDDKVTFEAGGRRYVDLDGISATEADGKTIKFNKAYKVAWPVDSGGDANVYTVVDPAETNQITVTKNCYVKAGYALQVVAVAAKTTLAPKTDSKWTLGAATFNANVNSGKATYNITLDKNIANDEFAAGLSTTATTANLVAVANGAAGKQATISAGDQAGTFEITVSGVKSTMKPTAKWLGYMGTAESLGKLSVTCEAATDKITVTLTNNTNADVILQAARTADSTATPPVTAASAETGVLEVTVGELTFNVTVTVTEATT